MTTCVLLVAATIPIEFRPVGSLRSFRNFTGNQLASARDDAREEHQLHLGHPPLFLGQRVLERAPETF
jgi:hypothetical protein